MSLLPCPTCPWRFDQDARAVQAVRPPLKAAALLRMVGAEDAFRPIMQCHSSLDATPRICMGYLVREGLTNLNVRILLATKKIENPDKVLDACKAAGIKLHRSYRAVLKKLARSL